MTLSEYSRYCWSLSNQAYFMDRAMKNFDSGLEQELWVSLFFWIESKQIADEINHKNDSMAFARAIAMSHGIKRAWS